MSLESYEYIKDIAKKSIRTDGRKPMDRRQITVKNGVIKHSDGSAYVEFGETKVIAGVKVLPGVPFPDRPDEGGLIVSFEASELASKYETDRILYSVEIGRVTDRGIRESNLIDLKKLSLEPGVKALFVYIDIFTVNNDGNLFDAANIAALSALLNARFKIDGSDEEKKLPLNRENLAVSSTFSKIGNTMFFDPNVLEENAADARITIGISNKINSIQKGGIGSLTPEEIDICAGEAFRLKQEIKDLLMSQVKD
jgi:exosome complex component RRP42